LNPPQPVPQSPQNQQNSNQQQACENQQLRNQYQPYNGSYPDNQPPLWEKQNQYLQQDIYDNTGIKPKRQRTSRFATSLIASMLVILIASAIVFATNGNTFATALSGQSSSSTSTLPTKQIADAYNQALVSPLKKAGMEITDPNMATFYQKMVEAYGLDRTTEDSANGKGGLESLLPNLKKIIETALNTSLQEVGKQIKDKEIADFYNRFIQNIGTHE